MEMSKKEIISFSSEQTERKKGVSEIEVKRNFGHTLFIGFLLKIVYFVRKYNFGGKTVQAHMGNLYLPICIKWITINIQVCMYKSKDMGLISNFFSMFV